MPSLLITQAPDGDSVSEPLGNITFEDVKRAYDKLVAAGAVVTTRTVHAEIGRGSRSTVVPHVRALRRMSPLTDGNTLTALSPEVVRELANELERLVKQRTSQLNADLADSNESLDLLLQENQSLRSSLAEASAVIAALRTAAAEQLGTREALRSQHQELVAHLKTAEGAGEEAKKELALTRERLLHSEDKCAQLSRSGAEAVAELSAVRDALASAQRAYETSRHDFMTVQAELDASRRSEAASLRFADDAQSLQKLVQDLSSRAAAAEAERKGLAGRLEDAKRALSLAEANMNRLLAKLLNDEATTRGETSTP